MSTASLTGTQANSSIFEDVDTSLFIGALALVLCAAVPMILFPEASEAYINRAFAVATTQLGWMYMLAGFGSFLFLVWLAFGPLGHKVLGKREEIEYSNLTWISMLFCGGVGAGILFNAFSDWASLIQMPIRGSEPMSPEAAQWAQTYGIFHWGPIAWAMYASLAVPIGYLFYVRKIPMLNISQICRGLLGDAVDGPVGKVIDLLFMVGLLGAAATSLGLGTPIVAAGFTSVFGIERSFGLEFGVLVLVTLIFSASSFMGLQSGLKRLADFSVRTTAVLLLFVLLAGPTNFIIQMGLTNIGDVLNNFISLSTDMDPIRKSGVTEGWTVFYWAWWGAYMPFQSMFIAKISRGRTVREMLLGALVYASLGCAAFYIILGGFGVNLQMSGTMDVVGAMGEYHPATVVMQMADHLPLANIFQFTYAMVCAIFMATTFDAATFALAATTTKRVTPDEDPARWNRMFWSFAMALVPVGILMIDGPLTILQTASVLTGIPIIFVVMIGISSFFKDYKKNGWVEA